MESKLIVLLAFYAEYQKDLPDMGNVNYKSLDMDAEVFMYALKKLSVEGFIDGVAFIPPNEVRAEKIMSINRKNLFLTSKAVEYVENMYGLEELERNKKLEKLGSILGKLGEIVLKGFVLGS